MQLAQGESTTTSEAAADTVELARNEAAAVTAAHTCLGKTATIYVTSASGTVTGTAGDDVIVVTNGNHTINALAGDDTICGGPGVVTINAGDGNDSICEGSSACTGTGTNTTSGTETLNGGNGNDIIFDGSGSDHIDGGPGVDFVAYTNSLNPINANLTTGKVTGDGSDTLTNIEAVLGSNYNDTLVGGPAGTYSTLCGGGGNDTITGGAGFNYVGFPSATGPVTASIATGTSTAAGEGTDKFTKVQGILGSAYNDTLTGATATGSVLFGEAGNDTLNGGAGNDYLDGGPGNDVLNGNGGNDVLLGEAGNDTLNGGSGNDLAAFFLSPAGVVASLTTMTATGEGTDKLSSIEELAGSTHNDTLTGGPGNDALYGGDGNDTLSGEGGNDSLYGGNGNDHLIGGAGDDFLVGGPGTDIAEGDAGANTCSLDETLTTCQSSTSSAAVAEPTTSAGSRNAVAPSRTMLARAASSAAVAAATSPLSVFSSSAGRPLARAADAFGQPGNPQATCNSSTQQMTLGTTAGVLPIASDADPQYIWMQPISEDLTQPGVLQAAGDYLYTYLQPGQMSTNYWYDANQNDALNDWTTTFTIASGTSWWVGYNVWIEDAVTQTYISDYTTGQVPALAADGTYWSYCSANIYTVTVGGDGIDVGGPTCGDILGADCTAYNETTLDDALDPDY